MISPWEIYWVLQLDTIGTAASIASFIGLVALPFVWGFAVIEIRERWAHIVAGAVSLLWLVAIGAAVFLPSTKTAAAMLVIPAIANNERVQKEAGELYGLAKDALKRAGAPEPAPAEKAEK